MSELVLMGNPRRRHKKRRARRANPRRATHHRRRRRRNPETHVTRVRAARRGARHRRRNPIYKMHRRKRRRNPIGSDITNIFKTGAFGALGGLALDILVSKTSSMLPTTLQSGMANYAVKAAGAIGIGLIGEKALGPGKGRDIANGTMAIVLHEIAGTLIAGVSPTLATSLGISGLGALQTLPPQPIRRPTQFNPPRYIGGPVRGLGALQIIDPLAALTAQRVPGA